MCGAGGVGLEIEIATGFTHHCLLWLVVTLAKVSWRWLGWVFFLLLFLLCVVSCGGGVGGVGAARLGST